MSLPCCYAQLVCSATVLECSTSPLLLAKTGASRHAAGCTHGSVHRETFRVSCDWLKTPGDDLGNSEGARRTYVLAFAFFLQLSVYYEEEEAKPKMIFESTSCSLQQSQVRSVHAAPDISQLSRERMEVKQLLEQISCKTRDAATVPLVDVIDVLLTSPHRTLH